VLLLKLKNDSVLLVTLVLRQFELLLAVLQLSRDLDDRFVLLLLLEDSALKVLQLLLVVLFLRTEVLL
jgi:hypothetical protein